MNRRQVSAVVFAGLVAIAGLAAVAGAFGDAPSLTPGSDDPQADVQPRPDTGNFSLVAAENQTIRGETSQDPGTNLTVRVLSETPASPFIISREVTVDEGGRFRATVDLSAAAPGDEVRVLVLTGDRELINTTTTLQAPANDTTDATSTTGRNGTELRYQGDAVTLRNGPDQRISGETDLPSGTQVRIRLQSAGRTPLVRQSTTSVAADGSFSAAFNLSRVEPGTELTISVVHDGEQLLTVPGTVVAAEDS